MGEYAASYLLTKKAIAQKSKINKLESSFPNKGNEDSIKTEKERYFREVTEKPEFDQALEHLLQSVDGKGSDSDIQLINQIKSKKKKGNLEYSDIGNLESTVNRNFKYFFKVEPIESLPSGPSILGILLIAAAIILRVFYEFAESNALVLFLTLINLIAFSYTIVCIKDLISANIKEWLKMNNFPSALQAKLLDRVKGKLWTFLGILCGILAVGLLVSFFLNVFSLGNDIISILSLGVSVLMDQIVNVMTRHYEKNMHDNN